MSCVLPVGAAHTTHAPSSLFDGSVRLIQHCTRHSPCFDLPCLASVALKGEMIFMATRVSCRACGPPWFEGTRQGFWVSGSEGTRQPFRICSHLLSSLGSTPLLQAADAASITNILPGDQWALHRKQSPL